MQEVTCLSLFFSPSAEAADGKNPFFYLGVFWRLAGPGRAGSATYQRRGLALWSLLRQEPNEMHAE